MLVREHRQVEYSFVTFAFFSCAHDKIERQVSLHKRARARARAHTHTNTHARTHTLTHTHNNNKINKHTHTAVPVLHIVLFFHDNYRGREIPFKKKKKNAILS